MQLGCFLQLSSLPLSRFSNHLQCKIYSNDQISRKLCSVYIFFKSLKLRTEDNKIISLLSLKNVGRTNLQWIINAWIPLIHHRDHEVGMLNFCEFLECCSSFLDSLGIIHFWFSGHLKKFSSSQVYLFSSYCLILSPVYITQILSQWSESQQSETTTCCHLLWMHFFRNIHQKLRFSLSHSSIPAQDLWELVQQHLPAPWRRCREQRGCTINKSAPCKHPQAMRELKNDWRKARSGRRTRSVRSNNELASKNRVELLS